MDRRKILKLTGIGACVVCVAVGAFFLMQRSGLEFANATIGVMPGVDMSERQKQLQTELDEGMIAFSVNTNPTFENSASEGNLMLENPGNNNKLLTAEVVLNSTHETMYTSKALVPGSYIQSAKLDKPLAAGSYDATVYFKAYKIDTQEYIGQTGAQITLTVLT